MAFTTDRTTGGKNRSSSSLRRTGLGNVQTRMDLGPGQEDIFGGIKSAFSIDDLRKSMRRGGGMGGGASGMGGKGPSPDYMAKKADEQKLYMAKQMMRMQNQAKNQDRTRAKKAQMDEDRRQQGKADAMAQAMVRQAGARGGLLGPFSKQDLGQQIGAIGTDRAHEGLMQTGRLIMQPGGGGGADQPSGFQNMGANQQRELIQQMMGQGMNPAGLLGSREEGGGIPETGVYQLHEGEQVVPAPEKLQEMVMDMMVDRQMGNSVGSKTKKKRGKKGKKKKGYKEGTVGYEEGTDGSMEALMQMLGLYEGSPAPMPEGQFGETESGLPYMTGQLDPTVAGQEADVMDMMRGVPDSPGMPSPMDDPASRPNTTEENMLREGMQIRQDVANPQIHPQEALDTVAQERERMAERGKIQESQRPPNPFGAGYEGELTEGVGEAGERSFTLKGSEYTLEKRLADRYERDSAEIERMNDGAESHARYAAQLLEYAGERPNSGANERLRQMAGDRMKLAKEMQASATGRQKSLDLMVASQGQQMAEKEAAGIEAQGRVGSAQVGAQGRVAAAQAGAAGSAQGDFAKRMTELMDSYAGMEDADPEAREAALQQMMQLFMMMGGFQEALGGGIGG